MKNIDNKSLIIGILGTILIFVLVGATNQNENLGDIVVNSITVVDEKGEMVGMLKSLQNSGALLLGEAGAGTPMVMLLCEDEGGYLTTYNAYSKQTSFLGTDEGGSGTISTFNDDGKLTAGLGTAEGGDGLLSTYNADGKETAGLGTGKDGRGLLEVKNNGTIETLNAAGVRTGYFGTNKYNDGVAGLFDRYGDLGWVAEGKQ
ncbi:MAG: hypothetical protein H8E82_05820 [Candidatus Marinimicrobia bacterium]|nr:hypothetical protein [Candidatus Neomarinimicrobiota bacterium]